MGGGGYNAEIQLVYRCLCWWWGRGAWKTQSFGWSLVKIKASWAFCSQQQRAGCWCYLRRYTSLSEESNGKVQSKRRWDKHWHASGQCRSSQEMVLLHSVEMWRLMFTSPLIRAVAWYLFSFCRIKCNVSKNKTSYLGSKNSIQEFKKSMTLKTILQNDL